MNRNTGPTPAVRQQVIGRDRGWCRRCGFTGSELHHRIGRGAGGSKRAIVNDPSALVWLCRTCHRYVTENPEEAYATGWAIRRSSPDLPSEIPLVDVGGRSFFLTEEGTVIRVLGVKS